MSLRYLLNLLCSRGFKNICPVIRIEELCVKLGRKIRVLKARWVVLPHEPNLVCAMVDLPPAPKPLAKLPDARDREDTPVDENPDLRIVVPLGQGSGVQAGPVRGVARRASRCAGEEEGDEQQRRYDASSPLCGRHDSLETRPGTPVPIVKPVATGRRDSVAQLLNKEGFYWLSQKSSSPNFT